VTNFQGLSWKPLLGIEKELARERMLAGRAPRTNLSEGKALELFAEEIGVSYGVVQMALWLMENAPEEELEKGNPSADFLANGRGELTERIRRL
jgi:hypothetical protein